ncbi:hypothetical protein BS50DRAFT_356506 [Corynespora cassiicola Philippines]|uniref:Uncharacterized protein n=1 Tax=Corynespora cassiicola Philippines TaxID=1448308 RepID=A0A2T2NRJ6_CORCC|nr:hypothetical protein BS50DRAFT_356506 [Corynespora cassiicola Philippines]
MRHRLPEVRPTHDGRSLWRYPLNSVPAETAVRILARQLASLAVYCIMKGNHKDACAARPCRCGSMPKSMAHPPSMPNMPLVVVRCVDWVSDPARKPCATETDPREQGERPIWLVLCFMRGSPWLLVRPPAAGVSWWTAWYCNSNSTTLRNRLESLLFFLLTGGDVDRSPK